MDLPLKDINNEVLRKIGRNIVLYQYIEYVLKTLLINGNISGSINEIHKIREQQIKTIQRQTMGQLAKDFLAQMVFQTEDSNTEVDNLKDNWISFSFTFGDGNTFNKLQEMLSASVVERNKLVHHLLAIWDINSPISDKEIDYYLDHQHAEIQATIKYLQSIVNALQDSKKSLAEFISSHAFSEFLLDNRIITLLSEIALQKKRSDGWVELAVAGSLIQQQAAEEITALKEKYGCKTLKALLLQLNTFEIREERTPKGGVRVLYRMKEE